MDTNAVKKAYKRVSPFYNFVFNKCFQPGRQNAVGLINQCHEQADVLEVGVGTGLALPLYDRSLRVTGIDVSSEMLKKARKLVVNKRLTHVKGLLEMDAEHLSFRDNSFDAVMAMYVVSTVANFDKLMREVTRVCKPGGDIIVVNHFASRNKFIHKIEKKIAKATHLVGFKSDFDINPLLNIPHLKLANKARTNMFGYWTLLHFVNQKP